MATIHDITASRKAAALRYDATDGDLSGMATRVAGGYTFRPDTTQVAPPAGRRGRRRARRPRLRL